MYSIKSSVFSQPEAKKNPLKSEVFDDWSVSGRECRRFLWRYPRLIKRGSEIEQKRA